MGMKLCPLASSVSSVTPTPTATGSIGVKYDVATITKGDLFGENVDTFLRSLTMVDRCITLTDKNEALFYLNKLTETSKSHAFNILPRETNKDFYDFPDKVCTFISNVRQLRQENTSVRYSQKLANDKYAITRILPKIDQQLCGLRLGHY
jgi:hypothetical protein